MNTAREFLLQSQNADGGWGYRVGAMSFVEPTAAALIALEANARARDFLIAHQHADGGWGIAPLDAESGWMTAWAMLALTHSGGAPDAITRGAQWLLATQVLRFEESASRAQIKQLLAIDSTLRGFPWQPGDASWVQPTALALRALVAAGQRDHARVREGVEYLFDRASASGGWNVGNPWMIGKAMPVTIQDTALALAALRAVQIAASDARVIAALAFLRAASARVTTAAELTWTLVALRDWQLEIEPVRARLNALQRADGSWQGNPFITAIALSSEM